MLRVERRRELVFERIFRLEDIPDEFRLADLQRLVLKVAATDKPRVDARVIRDFLSELIWQLFFPDYETFASAVPLLDGAGPRRDSATRMLGYRPRIHPRHWRA